MVVLVFVVVILIVVFPKNISNLSTLPSWNATLPFLSFLPKLYILNIQAYSTVIHFVINLIFKSITFHSILPHPSFSLPNAFILLLYLTYLTPKKAPRKSTRNPFTSPTSSSLLLPLSFAPYIDCTRIRNRYSTSRLPKKILQIVALSFPGTQPYLSYHSFSKYTFLIFKRAQKSSIL